MNDEAIKILKNGGVGVLLTDTLYGLVGQALNEETVARIYKIKNRDGNKPLIILISSIEDLKLFEINVSEELKIRLESFWPGPTSIILPCQKEEFEYLHRGTNSLAFRLPKKDDLIEILQETGPLVAPSANPESLPPAQSTEEAEKYFSKNIDFYIKGPKPQNNPSKIIDLSDEAIKTIRK